MSIFSRLFKSNNLKKEIERMKAQLVECNDKLLEKQEVINKTNAYWKNKLREANNPKKKSKK